MIAASAHAGGSRIRRAGTAADGYRLNLPRRTVVGGSDVTPLVTVVCPAAVVEAVQLADAPPAGPTDSA